MTRAHILLHGTVLRPCGFTLINRRLAAGLRALGYRVSVLPNDGEPPEPVAPEPPDVYLFHGDPFDFEHAPGRLNAFFLEWEYRRLEPAWVNRLNERFDLVVAPSQFSKSVCEASGIRIPVRVCRGAVDRGQFNPFVAPKGLPTDRRFRFLHLGGTHERRGTDVLLAAYTEEFSAAEDVALIVKGFHYEHLRPWVEQVMKRARVGQRGVPEVVYVHQTEGSVAGYYAAADVGVFPVRAECLGLPVLECIASGRPVIVTGGTGLDEFCSPANARFIRATERVRRGKWEYEPDRRHLRELMRTAFERGKPAPAERARISQTVADFTWESSVAGLSAALEEGLRTTQPRPFPLHHGLARHVHGGTGSTAAGRLNWHLGRALAPGSDESCRPVVAEAGRALKAFRRNGAETVGPRVWYGDSAPLEHLLAISNRERSRCEIGPLRCAPIERWQRRCELEAADMVLVPGSAARASFLAAGVPERKLRQVPPGFPARRRSRPRSGPIRFLFVTEAPFRDGVRLLFAAWEAARLGDAELVCVTSKEVLRSPLLLRCLVKHSNVTVCGTLRPGTLAAVYGEADCVVVPSYHDGYSTASGLRDILTHGEDGWIVESGSVEALADALARLAGDRRMLARLGEAARETARRYPWERFERACRELLGLGP